MTTTPAPAAEQTLPVIDQVDAALMAYAEGGTHQDLIETLANLVTRHQQHTPTADGDPADAAWNAYKADRARRLGLNPRRAARQTRRRDFIAGYHAALADQDGNGVGVSGEQEIPTDVDANPGWIDRHGDVWREGADGLMHTPDTQPFPREHVERKWGPLAPAGQKARR